MYFVLYTMYCVYSVSVNVVFVLWLAFALMLQDSHGKWSSPRLKMRIHNTIFPKRYNSTNVYSQREIQVNSTLNKALVLKKKGLENGWSRGTTSFGNVEES